jgi:hypothetical protein
MFCLQEMLQNRVEKSKTGLRLTVQDINPSNTLPLTSNDVQSIVGEVSSSLSLPV